MSTNVQDTSLEAFESIKHSLVPTQMKVLDVFYENPNVSDWTNLELARNLEWDINRVTGRVHELRELGILTESRRRLCKIPPHRRSIAWRVKKEAKT